MGGVFIRALDMPKPKKRKKKKFNGVVEKFGGGIRKKRKSVERGGLKVSWRITNKPSKVGGYVWFEVRTSK